MRCLEAARLAAKPEDLRSISTGGKNFPSAIDVLRGVASTRMCRSCATKSEDVSLQTNHLHSLAINSGVLKIHTHLAWENILNAIICVGASRFYPFVFALIMHSWWYTYMCAIRMLPIYIHRPTSGCDWCVLKRARGCSTGGLDH